jgi:flavin-dependent dehydrogenase
MRTFLPSGQAVAAGFPGLIIDRPAFDRAIAGQAVRCGAELLMGTTLFALDPDSGLAWFADRQGQKQSVRYRALIAADGPHSSVARLLGLSPLSLVYTRQYRVPLSAPYQDTDIWLSDAFPGGYGWLFPKGRLANLGVGADRAFEHNLKAPLEALHARLVNEERVGSLVLSRTGGALPVSGLRSRLVEGRVLLVGDAAGFTHPISGAGIAGAVISGESAGRAAAHFVAGDPTALDGFEEDMRDRFEASLGRAVERRRLLRGLWRTSAAHDDRHMRRGWIAFQEYYGTQA